jgi:HEAT repeat protein
MAQTFISGPFPRRSDGCLNSMRILPCLFLIVIGLRAQAPPPSATRSILERSRQVLSEAFASHEYVDNTLLGGLLYQHHNRTALELIRLNQPLYPGNDFERIDPQVAEALVPLFEERLRDGPAEEKNSIALLIGSASGDRALAVLAKCAQHQPEVLAASCTATLSRMGDRAIPTLRALANGGGFAARRAALDSFGELEDRGSLQILALSLADADPEVRFIAAKSLAQLGDARGSDVLRQMLQSPDRYWARLAAAALAAVGDPTQGKIVRAWLDQEQLNSPMNAAFLLCAFRTEQARQLISDALKRKPYRERIDFIENFARPPVKLDTEALRLGLEDQDLQVRLKAAEIADRQGDPRGLDELSKAMTSRDPWVRARAIQELAIHPSRSLPVLRSFLRDPDPIVRGFAIAGIRKAGDASDIPALMPLVEDQVQSVAIEATYAVTTLSPRGAIQGLAPKLDSNHKRTAICAAAALAYLIEGEK